MNRLAASTSPYLRQHKDNPVDWWPWCPEAFDEARRLDRPVLLSVGYSACHWCHVMAHESFEDLATAQLVNDLYVPVKVDREERPDVDAVYMAATVAMTGQGGWPMTAFLTPGGEPFFAGTYYPREAFQTLLSRGAAAWRDHRGAILEQGRELLAALGRPPATGSADFETAALVTALATTFDATHGGFGGAPKFPPSMVAEFLLRHAAAGGPQAGQALAMVEQTCERMARGGLYDQLVGGFARYCTDARWVVPHFEKMLYDNALLLRLYAHLWRQTGSALARRVALEVAGWMRAELTTPEGGFASALDADSDGAEGRFYVWTPAQLAGVLGPGDGAAAAELLVVTGPGTFEDGASVLQLPVDPPDADWWARVRAELARARSTRPRPARDDKVVAAWNGLAIAGLAEVGVLFDRGDLVAVARAAAELLVQVHLEGGRLRRTSRDGSAGPGSGVLEDYADVAEGFLALHQASGELRWLETAGELLDVVLDRFADGEGAFFDTADDAEQLVLRPRDPTDNATPSGTSAAAGALLTYAALTGSARHRAAAEAALRTLAPLAARHPRFAGWAAAVAEAAAAGPLEVAVVGREDLARVARRTPSPGAVVVTGGDSPLLADRPPGAAYVCRAFTCQAPTTDAGQLAVQLGVTLPP
ncbi:MAG: thioredoxin domain-containing protein [Mycobacteriales bacterium]